MQNPYYPNRHSFCNHGFFLLASSLVFLLSPPILFAEQWTDLSGKHSVEAEFQSLEADVVILLRPNGKQTKIKLGKLSTESRRQASKRHLASKGQRSSQQAAKIRDFKVLSMRAKQTRSATQILKLYEAFLKQPGIASEDQDLAKKQLQKWKERAQEGCLRWGRHWMTVDEIQTGIKNEERLLKEAHRMMEVGNNKKSRERFQEASGSNPEGIRPNFYLGILDSLLGQHAKIAEKQFTTCLNRLQQSPNRLEGTRRSNLIAALNNRAICRVRLGKHSLAMKDWREAIEMAPMTPELVQNLGYYARLASVVPGWKISRSARRMIADSYAQITVANQSAAFQKNIGWLFIPYIDAPTLPDFESLQMVDFDDDHNTPFLDTDSGVEKDFRIVGWATGVAVDSEHLLLARRSINRSQGLWIRQEGVLRKDIPGKVVAISGSYDLALVRFRGLGAKVIPLATEESKRATDICTLGFPEPGILGTEPILSRGTIVDIRSRYIPLGKQYFSSVLPNNPTGPDGRTATVYQTVALPLGKQYVTALIHDVFMNRGSLGTPLFNQQGRIMGLNLEQQGVPENGSFAVNHTEIRAFLATTSLTSPPITEASTDAPSPLNLADLNELVRAAASTTVFQIAIVGRVPRLAWSDRVADVQGIRVKAGWNGFEDYWCMRCNGRGRVACPRKGCVKGWHARKVVYIRGHLPSGDPIHARKWVKDRCSTCNTTGGVACPHCRGERREPSL